MPHSMGIDCQGTVCGVFEYPVSETVLFQAFEKWISNPLIPHKKESSTFHLLNKYQALIYQKDMDFYF